MVQKVEIILVDDLDGTSAEETVHFSLDGTNFEIDLSAENARRFRAAVEPFISKARPVTLRAPKARAIKGRAPASKSSEAADIRSWARANGYEVSERGRVNASIIEAYRNAQD